MATVERILDLHIGIFVGMTLLVMGGAALLVGQAVASTWRPARQAIFYCLLLGVTTRFFSLSLFYGDPFFMPGRWAYGAIIDAAVLIVYGLVAYRATHVAAMTRQYPWLVRRSGLFNYRAVDSS